MEFRIGVHLGDVIENGGQWKPVGHRAMASGIIDRPVYFAIHKSVRMGPDFEP